MRPRVLPRTAHRITTTVRGPGTPELMLVAATNAGVLAPLRGGTGYPRYRTPQMSSSVLAPQQLFTSLVANPQQIIHGVRDAFPTAGTPGGNAVQRLLEATAGFDRPGQQ